MNNIMDSHTVRLVRALCAVKTFYGAVNIEDCEDSETDTMNLLNIPFPYYAVDEDEIVLISPEVIVEGTTGRMSLHYHSSSDDKPDVTYAVLYERSTFQSEYTLQGNMKHIPQELLVYLQ